MQAADTIMGSRGEEEQGPTEGHCCPSKPGRCGCTRAEELGAHSVELAEARYTRPALAIKVNTGKDDLMFVERRGFETFIHYTKIKGAMVRLIPVLERPPLVGVYM